MTRETDTEGAEAERADPAGEAAFSELILVRLSGDLTTKAEATRKRFVSRLVANIKDALKAEGCLYRVERSRSRLFVHVDRPGMSETLRRVFGIQSVSRVEARPWQTLDDVVAAGEKLFGETVRGQRFAVRARRVGERREIPLSSGEVERRLGAALLDRSAGVDLSHPDCTVHVELMPDTAYFHAERIQAEGGLPIGCEGRAVSLVSGGFDSPVATWQLMRRGVALDFVFCNLGGRPHQLETLEVMKVISDRWSYGSRPRFHAVDFEDVSNEIQTRTATRYWQVILKRMMYRAADAVAHERGALAIVTGEAIGQVSSQTLQNLAVIERVTRLPVLRPLVGYNKQDIIRQAEHVGTAELSKKVGEYCAIVPSRPATRALLDDVEREEARMDPGILERAISERSVFDLRTLELGRMELEEIQADGVPPGATVIDLRSKPAFDRWHYPEALHLEFSNAMQAYPHFDARQRYLVYCEFGLKSAHLADRMRSAGLDAQHFSGGEKALRTWLAGRGRDSGA